MSNYRISTYKSVLTNRKTTVIIDNDGQYGNNYLEYQLKYQNGGLVYSANDGFRHLVFERPIRGGLKKAIRILTGKLQ